MKDKTIGEKYSSYVDELLGRNKSPYQLHNPIEYSKFKTVYSHVLQLMDLREMGIKDQRAIVNNIVSMTLFIISEFPQLIPATQAQREKIDKELNDRLKRLMLLEPVPAREDWLHPSK